jgi:hypothetical protein
MIRRGAGNDIITEDHEKEKQIQGGNRSSTDEESE